MCQLLMTPDHTLTSPTVYISYDKLYAGDSCSGIGQTYYNQIVALTDNSDLSSMAFYRAAPNALEAVAEWQTYPFDLNNLNVPASDLPESVYKLQPRCWSASEAAECNPEAGDFDCPKNWTCPR